MNYLILLEIGGLVGHIIIAIYYGDAVPPGGMTEDDIKVFIRDDSSSPWTVAKIVSIDKSANIVYVEVTHFSQITAGFMSALDLPLITGRGLLA